MLKKFLFLQVFAISSVLLVSCGHKTDRKKNEVHLYLQSEPTSLDTRRGGERRSLLILKDLFEGLVRFGKENNIELAIANSLSISNDGLMYTFTLRPSRWSNGKPVTASNFVTAWKKALDPDCPSSFAHAYFFLKNAKRAHKKECSFDEIGVQALDDLTLQVTLEHPTPYFLEFLANPLYSPLPDGIDEQNPNWPARQYPDFICNGPFILKEHVLNSHLVLEKNPLYWNPDTARSERIIYTIVEDPQTAYNMFRTGDLDWFGDPCGYIPLEMCKELQTTKELHSKEILSGHRLFCGTTHPALSSAKIRRALACAINRKELCENLMCSGETPAFSIIHPALSLLDNPTFTDNDPEAANALFEEGLKELGLTRETYPILIFSHWQDQTMTVIAEIIQQQLQKNLGIQVSLDGCDWGTMMNKLCSGKFQLATANWFSWFDDQEYDLEFIKFKDSRMQGPSWENPQFIHLLDQAAVTNDPIERNALLKQAELIAMTEMPIIPVLALTCKFAKSPSLKGESLTNVGYFSFKWLEKEG